MLEVNLRTTQVRKHTRTTLALKPTADITRSPKQGHEWPHKKKLMSFKHFFGKNVN